MPDPTIKCPYCGKGIPLTEALSNPIKEVVRKEYEDKARERDVEFKRREEELTRKFVLEKPKLLQEAQRKVREEIENELKDLKEDNAGKAKLLQEARNHELELRKKARELEEKQKGLEIEVARRLDAERDKIRQGTLEMFTEEHRLKDLEKDKKINDLDKALDEAKRKIGQGSTQTQGEVLELDLEALLKLKFPADVVEPVPKGVKGADILQKVYTRGGQCCGVIAWESKRTKAWDDKWISKLKDDQREVNAEMAVLVTEALPKGVGVNSFTRVEGVWVTGLAQAGSLAMALREGLIEVAQTKLSALGKGEKMEAIYNYLSGSEFRHKIEAIVESFKSMREDLESEKRAMTKIWAKREKQIERVVTNTVRMYGDMQGIIGAALPEIKTMELGSGLEDNEE